MSHSSISLAVTFTIIAVCESSQNGRVAVRLVRKVRIGVTSGLDNAYRQGSQDLLQ
jgi:hypothetical protein